MNSATFDKLRADLLASAHDIADAKRPAYTIGSEDVLANFKRVAERTGLTPQQVCCVYLLKHTDAICAAVKDSGIPQAEDLKGRFADAINYLVLLWAVMQESNEVEMRACSCGTVHCGQICPSCGLQVVDAEV